MKFPLSWFKTFLPTKLSPQQIADALTRLGFEVEAIEPCGISFSNVVVAEVVSTEKHPDADKLTVAQVSDGTSTFQVVCGAANCREGIRVAYAKVGAELGDFTIEVRKLRGVESFGMLCAHDELDLPKEPFGHANGIMELDETFVVGRHLGCYFGDLVFEVALTPNLAYAAHVRGLAHELGAFLKEKVQIPSFKVEEKGKRKVAIESAVPRYACRVIENVKVESSPQWLQERIEASGLRSVNNIVDATNYVMLEMGQPLHAFDLDKIEGEIHARAAKRGETIITLDDQERILTEEMIVIADDKKAVAIAGVMGGKNSEVSEMTTNILLEAAYFEPSSVRRTAKRLEMSTDASYRFERGTNPNALLTALDQVTSIILEVAGGKASPINVKGNEFPDKKVKVRVERVNQILGTQLAISEVELILRNINLKVQTAKGDELSVSIPPYRHDLNEEIDLIEEVARFYGYDNIANEAPTLYRNDLVSHDPSYLFERRVRHLLLQEGLQELLTCDLIGPKDAQVLAHETTLIHLANPGSHEQSILRPSLLPSLLRVVQHNRDHDIHDLAGFEVGKLHLKVKDTYLEPMVASIVLAGKRTPAHWSEKGESADYFDLKGIVESFLSSLHIEHTFEKSAHPSFHPGRQASVIVNGGEVGILGQVHPTHKEDVYFAELYLDELQKAVASTQQMRPLPQFPSSSRDLTLTVPKNVSSDALFAAAKSVESKLLEAISLIDVYHSEKLGSGVKNMTFRFVYRDPNKTLSVEEVEKEHAKLTNKMTNSNWGTS
ncbi:MAG: phenylalanine--tRNA ligase subunit beta [Chlamydiales bacterium]|nr:phenylalanine--tRNA ligase subunit beta [Chlamydiales bacterium]